MKYLLFILLLAAAGRIEPYKPRIDPEFIDALAFLSEEKLDGYNYASEFLRWRDKMQWQAVRLTLQFPDLLELSKEEIFTVLSNRHKLVQTVEKYPLWELPHPDPQRLPAVTYDLWQRSRQNFLSLIKNRSVEVQYPVRRMLR